MNYKVIHKKNASSLYFLSGRIIFSDSNRTNTFIDDISVDKYLSILKIIEFKSNLFYFEENKIFKIEDCKLNLFLKFEKRIDRIMLMNDNAYLCCQKISRKEYNISLHRENVLKWFKVTTDSYKKLNDNFFMVSERFDETKFSIHNLRNEVLWHYNLPEGFKIFGSVQVLDDVLFFRITDSNLDHSKNIGLKLTTGEVLWEIENTMYFQIDYKNKLLRGYSGAYYQVVNPFMGTLLINNYLKENWNNGIHPSSHDNTITEDKLWFVSGSGVNTKFGAIDLVSSEIDFIQDFPLENGEQLDKPVYHQGKLYLRATNNVLYVLVK
ncbi:hypothetical protein [Myroides odoratus]|uniref:Uncharacterized protein n=1 Tax=Myroides odoratus TaxID=256 RepID=A0A9Q7E9R8_MYROD|nr:hypothetical protein [Myroides odoratus]EHQ43866.1 hypothetical protein Myrod_3047 [Myroides odoratus DSM 2801]EKB04862.1 hypothetical protein HMPREF9716_03050 [Myroides odoratus CIP 103059]QQU01173.1 hypothetical protein I6I88_05320 [Myroides odoratus]WQD56571.1 hypothetical protein U0010_13710 [Myroides odoratus]STZ31143.1 Uncharacterised protein [Myroides odoratus]